MQFYRKLSITIIINVFDRDLENLGEIFQDYDPSKVVWGKRGSIEETRKYLALKGLLLVLKKLSPAENFDFKHDFRIGEDYKLRIREDENNSDYLPPLDTIFDDSRAPIEILAIENKNISWRIVDKKRLQDPEGKETPVKTYEDLLLRIYFTEDLPLIETQKHVILKQWDKRKGEFKTPENPMEAEPDGLGYGRVILESEVEVAYEIDLAMLRKYIFILRWGNLFFSLYHFFQWWMNLGY